MKYDPDREVDRQAWADMDEAARMAEVQEYHRRHDPRQPNPTMHAIIHVVVENQIALGDEFPAEGALERLMREGLSRHDAVHAIGSVVAEHICHTLKGAGSGTAPPREEYVENLGKLTAESWRKKHADDEKFG